MTTDLDKLTAAVRVCVSCERASCFDKTGERCAAPSVNYATIWFDPNDTKWFDEHAGESGSPEFWALLAAKKAARK